jgi:hypothetical protein
MEITDKYISTSAKATTPTSKNIVLSDDAYAIAEYLDKLIKYFQWERLSK